MFTTSRHLTRLQVGHEVMVDGRRCKIVLVNDSRAVAVPIEKRTVQFIATNTGDMIRFEKNHAGVSISPNSEIPILNENIPNRFSGR